MELLISFIFLLSSIISFGQYSSSVDLLAGLNQSYRIYENEFTASEMTRNESEIPKFNYHIGVNYNKQISSLLHFKTGLRFVSMGYKTTQRELTFADGSPSTIQFIYDYLFFEIPINLRLEFPKERSIVPYFEAGLAPNFYVSNRAVQVQDGERRVYERMPSATDFRIFHLSANVAVGLNYYSNSDTCIFLQAHYKRHISNLVDTGGFEYQFAYGVEFGVRRSLETNEKS